MLILLAKGWTIVRTCLSPSGVLKFTCYSVV